MSFLGLTISGLNGSRAKNVFSAREAAMFATDVYESSAASTFVGPDSVRVCGSPSCSGAWRKPWKNRSRPIFEGEWGCSGHCVRAMVQAAVRREVGNVVGQQPEVPHRHRVPLGLVLLAQGWITHPQLQGALEAQRASGKGRIGDWLIESCGLTEERITRGVAVQWGCPVLGTESFSPSAMALVMPKRFVSEFGILPLRLAGTSLLYVAFAGSLNASAALALEQMSGLKVESGLLGETQFATCRANLLAAESVPVTVSAASDADKLGEHITHLLEQRQPIATRLVRVHQYFWMRMWLESGAMTGRGGLPSGTADVADYLFTIGDSGKRY